MVFLSLVEWVFSAVFILFILTQVVVPLWKGTKFFPFFRTKSLEGELLDAKEQMEEVRLEKDVLDMKEEISKLKVKMKKGDSKNGTTGA